MGLSTQTIPEGLKVENQQPQNDPIFRKILSNVSEVVDTFVNGIKQSAQAQQPHRQIYLAYNGSDLAHIVSKSTLAAGGPIKLPERAEIPTKYKWDLESFYPTDKAWEKEFARATTAVDEIANLETIASNDAAALHLALETIFTLKETVNKLQVYARCAKEQDTRVEKYQEMFTRAVDLVNKLETSLAFLEPMIMKLHNLGKLQMFLSINGNLEKVYGHFIEDVTRRGAHTMPKKYADEASQSRAASEEAKNNYKAVISDFSENPPKATISSGEINVDMGGYVSNRASENRGDRAIVFETFWGAFQDKKEDFAKVFNKHIHAQVKLARLKGYDHPIEMEFDKENINVAMYDAFLRNIHAGLPTLHRYLELRKKMLGVDRYEYIDMYPSIVAGADKKYGIEEAKQLTIDALKPLGSEYVRDYARGLNEWRWGDLLPHEGKYHHAYAREEAPNPHPLIITNFRGDLGSVSTMAHEFGHGMQIYLSAQNQPFVNAITYMLTAEVPSTVNQVILTDYLLKDTDDKQTQIALLDAQLDSIRTAGFRQAIFSEFEKGAYDMAARGEELTAEKLNDLYAGLLKEYYGHENGVTHIDDVYGIEWALLTHFYDYPFYVQNYTLSLIIAEAVADKILNGTPEECEKARVAYMEFLKKGRSEYPLDLLKGIGVDMTSDEPYKVFFQNMNGKMDRIEKLLAKD